ncbi:MAG: NADH-quinone oxidoreductase subunit NuoF [Nevskia sp.]|nr:NADH-quinone oxidoreductase subunit NuoF [Nevskia sp.]
MLTEHWGEPQSYTLDFYRAHGGYRTAPRALQMKPEELVEEVKKSGLRGRGGAGFPTGVKWGFLPKNDKPRYLCVNADESEPGTFKDRAIMEKTPHQLLEGIIISAFALQSHKAFIYIRGEYVFPWRRLRQAIDEAYAQGYLGRDICGAGYDLDVVLHRGAGAYICGEETALLESLEGKKGFPRLKPPFPATHGLFQCPTIINNVETLANVPWIVANGSAAYAALGIPGSTGTRMFCLSGHVNRPGLFEIEMGMPLMTFIDELGGGVRGGRKLKAVVPGGSSTPVLSADDAARANLDYDSMTKLDTFLGSGGVIVMDETTCMVKALQNLLHFYAHESCGQCTPCREGTDWLYKILTQLELGMGHEKDLDLLFDVADNMEGKTICPLAAAATMPTRSYLAKFGPEFREHIENKGCPFQGNLLADRGAGSAFPGARAEGEVHLRPTIAIPHREPELGPLPLTYKV